MSMNLRNPSAGMSLLLGYRELHRCGLDSLRHKTIGPFLPAPCVRGLARRIWRSPTEEPVGVLWETGIGRRRRSPPHHLRNLSQRPVPPNICRRARGPSDRYREQSPTAGGAIWRRQGPRCGATARTWRPRSPLRRSRSDSPGACSRARPAGWNPSRGGLSE